MKVITAKLKGDYNVYLFYVMLSLCLGFMLLYMYFLSSSIVSVVVRKEAMQEISMLRTQISALETTYIEAQHQLSSDIAQLSGFVPVEKKVFIDRTPQSLALSGD